MSQPEMVAFTGALVWMFPELMPEFAEHLSDNEGEVLPHVFMAQVERWAEQLVSERLPLVERLLEELERGYERGGEPVRNLIDVSFVENLPYPKQPHAELRALLPPRLMLLLRHGV